MKIENIYYDSIDREITFLIGNNAHENFDILDQSNGNDIWFHAKDYPSCHVIAKIPFEMNRNILKPIIKKGALLCKQNTNKLLLIKNLKIIYTEVNNIKKTNVIGTVNVSNKKEIII